MNRHIHTSTGRKLVYTAAAATILAPSLVVASVAAASPSTPTPTPTTPPDALEVDTLATGLQGASGGTVGPDGALYVAEGAVGTVTRIDPETGAKSTFASGLPLAIAGVGIGGAIDVAFVDDTAYVLVTLPGATPDEVEISGIYRVDGTDDYTIVADIGAWSRANPPDTPFDDAGGLQFSFTPVETGFLVSDGHHNRVLHVDWEGAVTEVVAFDDIVPTGITTSGDTVYLAEAGPIPHNPEDGTVVSFTEDDPTPETVASGYSLLVDVAVGSDDAIYALSQGDSPGEVPAGSPALADSGELLLANDDGTFSEVVADLDRPTSLHFIGEDAFVVTLDGDVLKIDGVLPDTGKTGGDDGGYSHHHDGGYGNDRGDRHERNDGARGHYWDDGE